MMKNNRFVGRRGFCVMPLGFVAICIQQQSLGANLEGSISYGRTLQSISLATRVMEFTPVNNLKAGIGARSTFLRSQSASFSTAEASEITEGRIENIHSGTFSLLATNAMIFADYQLSDSYGLNISLDAVGFSFGRDAVFTSEQKSSGGRPRTLNFLVFDKYDHGTLNSMFLVTRKVDQNMTVSLGLAHQFVEYTVDNSFKYENRRYRLKSDAAVVSLSRSFD